MIGNQQWVVRYNGLGNPSDSAYDIAIDSLNNIYVTGGNGDYITIKYDTNGAELWVANYNGTANSYDYAQAIALDSLSNVYVTGYSKGNGSEYDYATVKYDPNGNQLWAVRYNGLGNSYDYSRALVLDESGNVYVTGRCEGSGTYSDYVTVAYDNNGTQLWSSIYNGPTSGSDEAKAIVLDDAGNIYITGESNGYCTIKYSKTFFCIPELNGNCNGDCKVDFGDLLIFASHWLE